MDAGMIPAEKVLSLSITLETHIIWNINSDQNNNQDLQLKHYHTYVHLALPNKYKDDFSMTYLVIFSTTLETHNNLKYTFRSHSGNMSDIWEHIVIPSTPYTTSRDVHMTSPEII